MSEDYYYNLFDDISWDLQTPKCGAKEAFLSALKLLDYCVDFEELFLPLDNVHKMVVVFPYTYEVNDSGEWRDEYHKFIVESDEELTEFEILFQIQLVLNDDNPLTNSDHHYFEGLCLLEESVDKDILEYEIVTGS